MQQIRNSTKQFINTSTLLPNVTTLRSGICYRKSVCRL